MLNAMEEHFPPTVRWIRPQGGLFLWTKLPAGMDAAALLHDSLNERVAFVPGASFHANGGGANTMRLNFSNARPKDIYQGITRLGQLLDNVVEPKVVTP